MLELAMTEASSKCVQFSDLLTSTVQYLDEPPDLFGSVRPVELVESYRRGSCHYNCRPIAVVMEQLSVLEVIDGRAEVLNLSNLRLSLNQVEAMEEIFRRVRFGLIDVEGATFEEEGAVSFFEILQFYDSALKLNMASVRGVGARGWVALMKMLRRTPCLSHLDLGGINLEAAVGALTRAFRYGACVSVLHLENTGMSGLSLSELVNGLRNNLCLRELYLGSNGIGQDDVAYLKYLMSGQVRLRLLDLSGNDLRDGGLSSLAPGLGDSLCHLHLNGNRLGPRAMGCLAIFMPALKCLTLSNNHIGDEGLSLLRPALFRCKRLRRLELRNCGQSSEGIIALAEFMADSKTISQIDLRANNLKSAAFFALVCALRINRSLRQLLLDSTTPDLYDLPTAAIIDDLLDRNKSEPDENVSLVSYDTSSLLEYSGALAATSTGNFIVTASSKMLRSIRGLFFGSPKKECRAPEDESLEFGSVELEGAFDDATVEVDCGMDICHNNF